MRMWHKWLLPALPRTQLLGQWRECCAIAKAIYENGTPNHILVNKVIDYTDEEFNTYANMVADVMKERGYTVDIWKFYKWRNDINDVLFSNIFIGWHNMELLRQNMANLMEKHSCGGITDKEWELLCDRYKEITGQFYRL